MTAPADLSPAALRALARRGDWTGSTAGASRGWLQCNLAILPEAYAGDFEAWCRANPRVCPLVAVGKPGDPRLPALGADIDLRTDLPGYSIFRHGEPAGHAAAVGELWRDDFVAFAFGCSLSFEDVLIREGVDLRYLARGEREAIYRSTLESIPAGGFAGPLIVSMRPLRPADAIRAIEVTARYPLAHGSPVHIGKPAAIGVDPDRPMETLGRVSVQDDELPVFWACGVTPQLAIRQAAPDLCITHRSAHMLVTDIPMATLRDRSVEEGLPPLN
ncbi:MAG: DUF1445 domain-containing protein [Rhodospirillaceae bacterium]|nr:DUF1445 domain-containing protein [Rhodospirillaceae bacterium]MCY4067425.1 DUF1445 domain-containing protein [Rhodospirillaceae bacterium]